MTGQDLIDDILKTELLQWFQIITIDTAAKLWNQGKDFFLLHMDGTDRSSTCYDSWKEIVQEVNNGALLGTERKE